MREVGRREGLGQPRRRLICFCFGGCRGDTPLEEVEVIFVRVMGLYKLYLKGMDDASDKGKVL